MNIFDINSEVGPLKHPLHRVPFQPYTVGRGPLPIFK